MTSSRYIIPIVFVSLYIGAMAQQLAPFHKTTEPVKDSYIVVLKDDAVLPSVIETLQTEAEERGIDFKITNRYGSVLNGFAATFSEKGLEMVRSNPAVKYVEQDAVAQISGF